MNDATLSVAEPAETPVVAKPPVEVFVLPASFGQERLWFLDRLDPGGSVYNQPVVYRLGGRLDRTALERSLAEIVQRHEVLRTSFATEDGVVVQQVHSHVPFALPVTNVPEGDDREERLQQLVNEEVRHPFDLGRAPLFRARLFRAAADDHVLALTFHHIIFDGWSEGVLLRELQQLYPAFRDGKPSPLPELPIQFADYAVWQREQLTGEVLERQREYWKRQLAGIGALDLPTDRPRPRVQTFRGAHRPLAMSPALTAALKEIGLREKATLFAVTAAAFQALLHRYTGQEDVPLGITVANRSRSEVEDLLGFFANTLVLRADLSGDPPFVELLSRVRDAVLGAFANQDLPFEKLVEEAGVERDLSRSPLFQVLFNQAPEAVDTTLGDLSLRFLSADVGISKFDLSVYFSETAGRLQGFIEYNTDLFDAATIERLVGHYRTLLEGVVLNPKARLSELPLLTGAERRDMLQTWNRTEVDYPREATVAELFAAQAQRRPNAVAVRYENATLTYGALNQRADALAAHLRSLGVRPGVLVGICVERSLDMIVGLMGTLKAGGAYVPLDPSFPAERLAFMLSDSQASVLLTQSKLRGLLASDGLHVVELDRLQYDAAAGTQTGPQAAADDLAYVLYTSGSTGKPKGVEIPHKALTNFLCSMQREPGCSEHDVLAAVTTLSFDIAGLEIYLPLISGGQVDLVSRNAAADGRLLREHIERTQPTILQATPATWRMLLEAGWKGSSKLKALIGGESLPADLAALLLERVGSLWNMYGPTETTIWSSVQRITSADEEITIGRPIANTTFYILDRTLKPAPINVPGELFIGGDGLARGYRGRPELTAEKFIAHPFKQGERLYRTGDLARWRPDGQVVHLGRLDHQVKIRGFRIELGEIETTLTSAPGVAQAVVVARPDHTGAQALVAYIVSAPGERVEPSQLRAHLRQSLPEYMTPQYFVSLDELPLTPNGKIDRKALPAPQAVGAVSDEAEFVPPRTPTEEQVAGIFSSVLNVERVGAHSNFFDLGGTSLSAIRLMSRIETAFAVELPLQVLFEAPTVAGLSERICDLTGAARASAAPSTTTGADRAPQTMTERRLAEIWERVLGVPVASVGVNFVELQGRTNRLESMLAEVRRVFGFLAEGFPVNAFLAAPTLETLARLIDAAIERPSSLVVPLRSQGAGPPIFLIHAGGGYVFFYRALASRVDLDRPIYGVRAVTSADRSGPPFHHSKSVEELAERYIAEIKTVQPEGPYTLGGACFGGVIAFEMARRLQARGERVESPLLLFDAFVRDPEGGDQFDSLGDGYAVNRAAVHLRRSANLKPWQAVWYLTRKAVRHLPVAAALVPGLLRKLWRRVRLSDAGIALSRRLASWSGAPERLEHVQRLVMERFMDATLRMLMKYRPGVFDGRLVIFKASNGPSPEPGWSGLARDGMVVHEMPGVHLDMMEEPAVIETASLVSRHLAARDAPRATQ